MKLIAYKSLGCRLNQYEIQAIREQFANKGFIETSPKNKADYLVINSCTVTSGADSDTRHQIRSFHRRNPEGKIIVTGCYAEAEKDILKQMPGVELVMGNQGKNQILHAVTKVDEDYEEASPFFQAGIRSFENKAKAFVKVQDGCNYFCTFCKIPIVRGRLASREKFKIISEVKSLIDNGFKEITLTGVCLGSYGRDVYGENRLVDLIRNLILLEGEFRIRLSSIDPRDTPIEIAQLMAGSKKLCRHLHLSLQSGSDKTLKAMKRGYTSKDFKNQVEEIRRLVPSIGLTMDIIFGFPGESSDDFETSVEYVKELMFHRVHIFPYSDRPKTKAMLMDCKISPHTIKERVRIAEQTIMQQKQGLYKSLIGKELEMLVEHYDKNRFVYRGYSSEFYPCAVRASSAVIGSLVKVVVTDVENNYLLCRLIH